MMMGLFKYIQIIFIATILILYHMYNGIHKFSELKVKFHFLKYFSSKHLCFLSTDTEL